MGHLGLWISFQIGPRGRNVPDTVASFNLSCMWYWPHCQWGQVNHQCWILGHLVLITYRKGRCEGRVTPKHEKGNLNLCLISVEELGTVNTVVFDICGMLRGEAGSGLRSANLAPDSGSYCRGLMAECHFRICWGSVEELKRLTKWVTSVSQTCEDNCELYWRIIQGLNVCLSTISGDSQVFL